MASAAEQLAANINLSAFAKATELKNRIWFTLGALVIYRLGPFIPLPGIDPSGLAEIFHPQGGGVLGMFGMFRGGARRRVTVFGVAIVPHVPAPICILLLVNGPPS